MKRSDFYCFFFFFKMQQAFPLCRNSLSDLPPPPLPFPSHSPMQGVIKLGHTRNIKAAIETLKEARLLCTALLVNPEHLGELLRLGASEESAIVALRKSANDVQRAAAEILDQVELKRAAKEDRAKQRRMGLTADKIGHVDLSRIETVKDFLAVSYDVAVALLRLANNNIDTCADVWHGASRQDQVVLERAHNISSRGAKRKANPPATLLQPVDEISLVTLMSTGIDKTLAEAALRNVNTAGARGGDLIEAAMDWLASDAGAAAVCSMSAGAEDAEAGSAAGDKDVQIHSETVTDGDSSSSHDDTEEDMGVAEEKARHQEAFDLFQRELGEGLQRSDIAEEHLGLPLLEESALIDKYLALALSQESGAK